MKAKPRPFDGPRLAFAGVSGYRAIEQCKILYIRVVPDMQALPKMSKARKMSQTPFMPLWVADFVGDTLDLDAKEVGAYMLILMTLWGRDGYLPNDEKKLQRVARCGRDWPRIWAAISHYFTVEGDKITQGRLMKELQKVASKREVKAQSGYLGGKAKALKSKETDLANATVSPKQPEPYLEPEKKEEAKASLAKRAQRLSADWFLPRDWGEWSLQEGMTSTQIRAQADTFKDYWIAKAGKDAAKADWQATWRNWCRKFIVDQGKGKANGQQNAAFGATINAVADGLSAGTIRLDNSRSDPFAPR